MCFKLNKSSKCVELSTPPNGNKPKLKKLIEEIQPLKITPFMTQRKKFVMKTSSTHVIRRYCYIRRQVFTLVESQNNQKIFVFLFYLSLSIFETKAN